MSGEKTLCQRYCEDSVASGGFFGQNRKLKRSRKTDLGVERSRNPDLGKKNPDLGAGSDAGQAAGWRSAKPYDRMIRMIRMTRRAGVSGKNMFIRHVLRHVEIKRFWRLGAAEM